MKRKWIIIAFAVALLTILDITCVYAEIASGSCGDNVTWTLSDEGVLTVSGTGSISDYYVCPQYTDFVRSVIVFQNSMFDLLVVFRNSLLDFIAFSG